MSPASPVEFGIFNGLYVPDEMAAAMEADAAFLRRAGWVR